MSISRPARRLFATPSIPSIRPRTRCRNFHSSPNLCERRRPRFASVKASEMGLFENKTPARELFKPYTAEEKAELAKKYTPEQLKAIELGEKAVDAEDLKTHGVIRTDIGRLDYLDDLSKTIPVIDQKIKAPQDNDPNWVFDEDKEMQPFLDYLDKVRAEHPEAADPEDPDFDNKVRPNRADFIRGLNAMSPLSKSAFAPAIPHDVFKDKTPGGMKGKEKEDEEDVDPRDPEGIFNKLIKQTGYTLDEIFELKAKVLVRHQVVNQTRLGKISSIYCLAIAGNGNGRLGIGQAKGQETEDTMHNARVAAIRNMQPIPRYEERTIFGDVEGKVSAVEVKLMARPPGFGLRCQSLIFEMARAAGLHDLAAKVPRSRNKMNTIKATYQAFMKQRIPDEIALGRGKKLVDVRKVYYAGKV